MCQVSCWVAQLIQSMLWLQLQPVAKVERKHFAYPAYHRHTVGIPSAYTFTRFHQLMQAPIGPRCLIFVSSRGAKLFFARVKSMASRFTQSKTHPRWQGGDTGYSKKRWHEIGMAAWPHGHCPSRCSALVQARMANGTNGTNGTSESNGPSTFKYNKSVSAK